MRCDGRVVLDPDRPLREVLTRDAVAVSDDLLARLGIQTGATVHLGEAQFAWWAW